MRIPSITSISIALILAVPATAHSQACSDANAGQSQFNLVGKFDAFEQRQYFETSPAMLTGSRLNIRAARLTLTAQLKNPNAPVPDVQLIVKYRGSGPLNIPSGRSLIFRSDTILVGLETAGSGGTRVKKEHEKAPDQYSETARFGVTLEQLRAISAADNLTVRVVGEGRNVDLPVASDVKCSLRRLYLELARIAETRGSGE